MRKSRTCWRYFAPLTSAACVVWGLAPGTAHAQAPSREYVLPGASVRSQPAYDGFAIRPMPPEVQVDTAVRQAASFEQLSQVTGRGQSVQVIVRSGQTRSGTITELTDTALHLISTGVVLEIPRGDIQEVRQRRPDGVGNGALIGALAGLSFGLLSSCAGERRGLIDYCQPAGIAMAGGLFGGIGAGIGVVVDASMVKWVTLYRAAEARRLTVKLAPRWSYGRSALFVSVSF